MELVRATIESRVMKMSRSNSEKLKLAISDAKSILGRILSNPKKGIVAKSKLNQLIGNRTIESF